MSKRKKTALYKQFQHEGGFVGLPRRVFNSPQYKSLSLAARCVLDELQNLHMPSRNGRIVFSVENAMSALGKSYNTASHAFRELEKMGFIERSLEADYTKGNAREWRLTYEACNGREPTDDWKAITVKQDE
ncbi:MAG: hypothetical protein H6855_02560 [Rhodospirillales bacterium]|nr:hypothetical protein [Rhodospirillales bacterium]